MVDGVTELAAAQVIAGSETIILRTFSLSKNGVTVEVSNVGASVMKILVPNFASTSLGSDDVVLNYASAEHMYNSGNPTFLGCIVGRVANRIAKGRFTLDGVEYVLATNNRPNHLHGGDPGFSIQVWDAKILSGDNIGVEFTLLSPDGNQGYPGTVEAKATYSLTTLAEGGAALELKLEGRLLDGKASPINLANHSYFNLAGHDSDRGVLDHELQMPSEAFTPVDATFIPTREVKSLDADKAMDWRSGRVIRDALISYGKEKSGLTTEEVENHFVLSRQAPDVATGGTKGQNPGEPYGFDHNYVVCKGDDNRLQLAGTVEHTKTGRCLQVWTDAPGVQLYTANWLDGSNAEMCKGNTSYRQWQGLCLETQAYPDSIIEADGKNDDFSKGKCCILRPGGPSYSHTVKYVFAPITKYSDVS